MKPSLIVNEDVLSDLSDFIGQGSGDGEEIDPDRSLELLLRGTNIFRERGYGNARDSFIDHVDVNYSFPKSGSPDLDTSLTLKQYSNLIERHLRGFD